MINKKIIKIFKIIKKILLFLVNSKKIKSLKKFIESYKFTNRFRINIFFQMGNFIDSNNKEICPIP